MNSKLNALSMGLMLFVIMTACSSYFFFRAYEDDKQLLVIISSLKNKSFYIREEMNHAIKNRDVEALNDLEGKISEYESQLNKIPENHVLIVELDVLKTVFMDIKNNFNILSRDLSGQLSLSGINSKLKEDAIQLNKSLSRLNEELIARSKSYYGFTKDMAEISPLLLSINEVENVNQNEVEDLARAYNKAYQRLENGFRAGKLPKDSKTLSILKAIAPYNKKISNSLNDISYTLNAFTKSSEQIKDVRDLFVAWEEQESAIIYELKNIDNRRFLSPLSVSAIFIFTLIWVAVVVTYGYSLPMAQIDTARNESGRYKQISSRLSKDIETVLADLSRLKSGDLSIRLDTSSNNTGDIARGINDYISVLEVVISKVKQLVTEISSAVEQSASTTKDMAKQREESSSRIDNTYKLTKNIDKHARLLTEEMKSTVVTAKEAGVLIDNGKLMAGSIAELINEAVKNQNLIESKNNGMVDKSSGLMNILNNLMNINKEMQNVAVNMTLLSSSLEGEMLERMTSISEIVSVNTGEVREYIDQVIRFAEDVHASGGDTKIAISNSLNHLSTIATKSVEAETLFSDLADSSTNVLKSTGKCIESAAGITSSASNIVEQVDIIRTGVNKNTNEIGSIAMAIESILKKTKELSASFSKFVTNQ